jgi:hypothetical protein
LQVNTIERRAVMRRSFLVLRAMLCLVVFASFGVIHPVSGQGTTDKEITVEGEVVDLHCYMTRHGGEGKGARHAACTNSCIRKGGSVGFVSQDGELYVLLSNTSAPIKNRVIGLGGKKVKITGVEVERHDVEAIKVRKIERIR